MFKYMLMVSAILLSANVCLAATTEEVENIPQKSASMQIDDNYNNWRRNVSNKMLSNCEAKGIDTNLPECDFSANIAYGDAIVKVKSDNYKWIDARSMAYTEALIDAYTKIALEQSTTNQNIILKELIDDQTPLNEEDLKTEQKEGTVWNKIEDFAGEKTAKQLDVLLDKAVALTGGKLDQELEKLGIDSTQYKAAPKEKKKTLLKSAITQKSITKALADTSGMIPLQTFEGTDGKGNYAVRVAVSK